MLEHKPVYTLGRGACKEHLLCDPRELGIELLQVERGGEVTYHGPGQLVCYPILNLNRHKRDLHWYRRQVEEVVIRTLAGMGLHGERVGGYPGVWVQGRKVAAVGMFVSRWVTMHGFALNVTTDMAAFARIVPCGIKDREVGSVAHFNASACMEDVRPLALQALEQTFNVRCELRPGQPDEDDR